MAEPTVLEYAVYGVLCAAKIETGPEGARRLYRIMERLDYWDDKQIAAAIRHLVRRGWVRVKEPTILGMIHYEVTAVAGPRVERGPGEPRAPETQPVAPGEGTSERGDLSPPGAPKKRHR
jgi:hypothetical protein